MSQNDLRQSTEAAPTLPWQGATNPVLSGFYPDPSACRVDGPDGTWYYLVNSTFEYLPGLPVHRSRDLVTWELIGHALDRPDQVDLGAVGDSGGMFAPTIRHDGTRFLLVCTLVGGTEGRSGNFVVTATDPAGPWSEPVWWHNDGIDPSILIDDDGRVWAHGTRLATDPEWDQQTEVWVRELDSDSLTLTGPEHVVWTGAVRGAVWAEGPHLYRHDGEVYLLASEGGTGFHHALSVARADSPTGPFAGNPSNPVLTHRNLGRDSEVINVGHADILEAPDGSSWALALATRPIGGVDLLGRETFLVPVEWQDGWPVFAPAVGRLVPEPPRPAPAAGTPAIPHPEPYLAVRRQPELLGDMAADGGVALVAGAGLSSTAPAYLGRRLTTVPATASVGLLDVPAGVTASLALRYSGSAWVAASLRAEGTGLVLSTRLRDADGERTLEEVRVEGDAQGRLVLDVVGLTAVARWEPVGAPAVTAGALPLDGLGAVTSGGFVGAVYGLLAEGEGVVTARELTADTEGPRHVC